MAEGRHGTSMITNCSRHFLPLCLPQTHFLFLKALFPQQVQTSSHLRAKNCQKICRFGSFTSLWLLPPATTSMLPGNMQGGDPVLAAIVGRAGGEMLRGIRLGQETKVESSYEDCRGFRYLGQWQDQEGSTSAGFHNDGQEFGVDGAKIPIPCHLGNTDVVVTLVGLDWLSVDMAELTGSHDFAAHGSCKRVNEELTPRDNDLERLPQCTFPCSPNSCPSQHASASDTQSCICATASACHSQA